MQNEGHQQMLILSQKPTKVIFGQESKWIALAEGHLLSLERTTIRNAWKVSKTV
jgi:hypothetical protein